MSNDDNEETQEEMDESHHLSSHILHPSPLEFRSSLHSPSLPSLSHSHSDNAENSPLSLQFDQLKTCHSTTSLSTASPPLHFLSSTSPTAPHNLKYIQQAQLIESFLQSVITSMPSIPPVLLHEGEEIDVTISGGGTKGYYVVGAYAILRHFINTNKIKVKRWAGASVGAASAVFMCCDVSPIDWISTYWVTRKNIATKKISIAEGFRERAMDLLPDNAHLLCNGKVFISITKLSLSGPSNFIVSHFESKEDLIEACVASLSIPFITSKSVTAKFRGENVWDGGVTNNSPLFTDSSLLHRRQLYFQVAKAPYPANMSFQFNDNCIESLVARGALLMRQFLLGQLSKKSMEIQWYTASPISEANSDHPPTQLGNLIRNSLTKIRSAPSLLKFPNPSEPAIPVDEEIVMINTDHHLNTLPAFPIVQTTVKEFFDLNRRRFLRAALFLLLVFSFFVFIRQGGFALGKSRMRIPIPQSLNFLTSIIPLRHSLSLS